MKIVSWNICFRNFEIEKRMKNLQKKIKEMDFDVVCLQEVTFESIKHFENWIYEKYNIYNSNFIPRQRTPSLYDDEIEENDTENTEKKPEFKVRHFLLILSKYPLQHLKKIHFPETKYQRFLFSGVFEYNDQKIYISNTHLETFVQNEKLRIAQWKYCFLCAYYSSIPCDQYIVTGDFNILDTDILPRCIPFGFFDVWMEFYPEKDGFTFDSFENEMARGQYTGRLDRFYVKYGKNISSLEACKAKSLKIDIQILKDDELMISDHFGLCLETKTI